MINVEKEVEMVLGNIDACGDMKRCGLDQWIDFLEYVSCEVDARYQAAKEDRARRDEAE